MVRYTLILNVANSEQTRGSMSTLSRLGYCYSKKKVHRMHGKKLLNMKRRVEDEINVPIALSAFRDKMKRP